MSQIILDFGSGNTCRNDMSIVRRMIDELKAVDTGKHEIIIKWQLFKRAGDNMPLDLCLFDGAYEHAKVKGYKTTSSVFDLDSLKFLLNYDIPFVKIANNRALDWLIGEVPRKIPVYVSYDTDVGCYENNGTGIETLACISKYPAQIWDYEEEFGDVTLRNISDHTVGLDLFKKYQPRIWEKHYVLEHDKSNLDGGLFATIPNELTEIL